MKHKIKSSVYGFNLELISYNEVTGENHTQKIVQNWSVLDSSNYKIGVLHVQNIDGVEICNEETKIAFVLSNGITRNAYQDYPKEWMRIEQFIIDMRIESNDFAISLAITTLHE
jgi:hypothetical protein